MIKRPFWLKKINEAWKNKSIVWLTGVRRAGKTFLAKNIHPSVEYFDCELNRVRNQIEADIQGFLESIENKTIIIDEIHRLENPAELLKVAADHYPHIKILATGSSTLAATKKFKDSLTDRKRVVHITPMILSDLEEFAKAGYGSAKNLDKRFLQGGLPPYYMSAEYPETSYQDWIDSYWAKDIQELYKVDNKAAFEKFIELLFIQSGGIFEASSFASPCKVSSPTISNYLGILEATFVAIVIRPYSKNKSQEIVSAPKVYGFDTGLVAYFNGWINVRNKDRGFMWEHFVLNELKAHLQTREINYWRDKRKREVDFVLSKRGSEEVMAIECKWLANDFDPTNLIAFRKNYPEGINYLVASDVDRSHTLNKGDLKVKVVNLKALIKEILS